MNYYKFFFLLLASTCTLIAYAEEGDSKIEEGFGSLLDWKSEGIYSLSFSHSTLHVPKEHIALFDEEARAFEECLNGVSNEETEVVILSEGKYIAYFSYVDEGYVSLDEWKDIDAEALIKSISEGTEEGNVIRQEKKISSVHIIGWFQEPFLDEESSTVFWATELISDDNEQPFINYTALKLGRNGYERMILVMDKEDFSIYEDKIGTLLSSHQYGPGYRYIDFTKGDHTSQYGIAALVAASAGGTVVKSIGILFVLKKLFAPILAATLVVLYRIKKWWKQ